MRIVFSSAVRPTRIVKSVHKQLVAVGHDLPFSKVREAGAVMFGYRSWNDLLGQLGDGTPFTPDQDLDGLAVSERIAVFARRLSAVLAIPLSDAAEAVSKVGPTSRGAAMSKAPPFDWHAAVHRMAASITEHAVSIRPARCDGLDGVQIRFPFDPPNRFEGGRYSGSVSLEDVEICTGPDGALKFRGSINWNTPSGRRGFGRLLHWSGLLSGNSEAQPDPLVLGVLGRLDGAAIWLLRSVPDFSVKTYDAVRAIPRDTPMVKLVDRLPQLGTELVIPNYGSVFLDALPRMVGVDLVASANPIEAYLDRVEEYASAAWPTLPFVRTRARRVLEVVGRVAAPLEQGLEPYHLAFLSFAPDRILPRTPTELAAAFTFSERWGCKNLWPAGITPEATLRDFTGSWVSFLAAVDATSDFPGFYALDEMAYAMAYAAAGTMTNEMIDSHLDRFLDCQSALKVAIQAKIVVEHGMMSFVRSYSAWRKSCEIIRRQRPSDSVRYSKYSYEALMESGLLPLNFSGLSGTDLMRRLGVDPDAYLDFSADPSALSFEAGLGPAAHAGTA